MDDELKASLLVEKIKHCLITSLDTLLEEATPYQFYQALCTALREEIMVNWATSRRAAEQQKARVVHYLSMEYLPGRILTNNLSNLKAWELIQRVCQKLGRSLNDAIGQEFDPGLGNGGLGRLASCFLDSLATLSYPAIGYGLRYQYGIFDQELWDGVQVERPDPWLLQENPWHIRRDDFARSVNYCGNLVRTANTAGDEVFSVHEYEEVRALPYDIPIIGYCKQPEFSVVTLRLWTTKESPRNFKLQRFNAGQLDQAAENISLTDVLYPSDVHEVGKRIRLKQEFLLVSASIQDIIAQYLKKTDNFDSFADLVRIQINDTHPAMSVAELMRLLNYQYNMDWKKAWETTQACLGFTQHTVLKESLEEWDQSLFRYLLPRQYRIIERINHDFLTDVRRRFPEDEPKVHRLSILEHGQVRMAHLAVVGSHKVNGVAKLQSELLKYHVFRDFYDLYPSRFINVTNGVTQRRWLLNCNPKLAEFLRSRIGEGWITDFWQIKQIAEYARDGQSQQDFLALKRHNKERLIQFLRRYNPLHDQNGHPLRQIPKIDPSSLFDVQIKRIHEYKRQLMNALHVIMLYQELLRDRNARKINRTVIFGGKAAAGYQMAKNIIRLIYCLSRQINNDASLEGRLKVLFVENYDVSKAELLIPAADLSEQISTAGLEASGTGNMKFAINGALTIGTEDGANIEMREAIGDSNWPFRFGCTADEIAELRRSQYRSWDIYSENARVRDAVEALRDGTISLNEDERRTCQEIYSNLLEGSYEAPPDRYFVLKDLPAYYETQRKVEELYTNSGRWAELALHNIAGMGPFSADRTIQEYAENVWGVKPLSLSPDLLEEIRHSYAEYAPTIVF